MGFMIKICGEILEGNKIGRKLGFPTLNLAYDGGESGVFVGRLVLGAKEYPCAVNLGPRPTVDEKVGCEVCVVDEGFSGLPYGSYVEVEILERIRDVNKFQDLDALKKAIESDVEFVKSWYNAQN